MSSPADPTRFQALLDRYRALDETLVAQGRRSVPIGLSPSSHDERACALLAAACARMEQATGIDEETEVVVGVAVWHQRLAGSTFVFELGYQRLTLDEDGLKFRSHNEEGSLPLGSLGRFEVGAQWPRPLPDPDAPQDPPAFWLSVRPGPIELPFTGSMHLVRGLNAALDEIRARTQRRPYR